MLRTALNSGNLNVGAWLRACLFMAIFLGLTHPLLGSIRVLTSPEILEKGAAQAPISSMLMLIDSDAFANASEENPVFVKVSLSNDVVLSETLAGLNQPPIYLALHLFANGAVEEAQIVAPGNAVALVRHIAGESSFWLRISQSSSCWISVNGAKINPSQIHPVALHFGIDNIESFSFTLPLFQLGWANLPSNTRDPDASGSPQSAEDTIIRADLSQSSLTEGGILSAEFSAFASATGVTTEANPQNITTGSSLPIFDPPQTTVGMIFPRLVIPGYDFFVDSFPEPLKTTGPSEKVGFMDVSMSELAFPHASPSNPVYLRIQLSSDARLSETLVDPRTAPANPIYLALKLLEIGGPNQVVAPSETASIVRWIAGEEAVWVKIISPSDGWITTSGSPSGPARFVSFSLGQTADESLAQNQGAHADGHANLPANTDDLTSMEAVPTEIEVDLSSGGVSPFYPDFWAHVRTFTGSNGVETSQSSSGIQWGTSLGFEGGALLGYLIKGQGPWGGLVLNSVPREIQPGGQCEAGGSLGFTIGEDLFPGATPETPIYVKLALPGDTTLCETRVNPANPDPIYLALSMENPDTETRIIAPPETMSIVRWVAGETALWLKVSQPTHSWLEGVQTFMPPNPDDRVIFAIGIDAATTRTLNESLYQDDRANLPANTHASQWPGEIEAASTQIKVDISQASMVPDPEPDSSWRAYVTIDPSAYQFMPEVETAIDPGTIVPGVVYPLSFPGTRELAYTTVVVIDPPIANQGIEVLSMEARPASDVNPVEYKWVNAETDVIISNYPSIIFDPIPDDTVKVRLEVKDPQGRTSYALATLLVNPDVFDLNDDGRNDILDLYFALPDWGETHDILFLISIPIE